MPECSEVAVSARPDGILATQNYSPHALRETTTTLAKWRLLHTSFFWLRAPGADTPQVKRRNRTSRTVAQEVLHRHLRKPIRAESFRERGTFRKVSPSSR